MIQLPESAFSDFDELMDYEDALAETLGDEHEVDGHDIGSGEINFYVFTAEPSAAFNLVREARDGALLSHPELRAASRPVDGEKFEPLWPQGANDFKVL